MTEREGLWVGPWCYTGGAWKRHIFYLGETEKDDRDLSQIVECEDWWNRGLTRLDLPGPDDSRDPSAGVW